jgi:hypothetical protein
MSDKDDSTGSKIVYFSGKENEWDDWSFGFLSRAAVYGYQHLLTGRIKIPTMPIEADDQDSTVGQVDKDRNKAVYALNCKAWGHLVTSLKIGTCSTAISIVRSYYNTTDYPDGNVYDAFQALEKHYTIHLVATIQKRLGEFYDKKLKKGQNPSVYITEMENLREKIKTVDPTQAMPDKSFILRILNTLLPEYKITVQILEMKLDTEPDKVTIATVRDALTLDYQRLDDTTSSLSTSSTCTNVDTVLYAGGFKGKCSKCGKYGHKRAECRSSPTKDVAAMAQGNGPQTKAGGLYCTYCKKPGHTKDRCFKLQNKKAGGGTYRPGGPNRTGSGGHDTAEVVLTVVECYSRLAVCDCCDASTSFGLQNRRCTVCLIGTYRMDMPMRPPIGRCSKCHTIAALGTSCVPCTEEAEYDDDEFKFETFDTDSVHLDLMTGPESFAMFGGNAADMDALLNPNASADDIARAASSLPPGLSIVNPRPERIPQFFPSPIESIFPPDKSDSSYFLLLLQFIASVRNHRYLMKIFLEQVGLWLHDDADEYGFVTTEVSNQVRNFVRTYIYNLVNLGILTVSHLIHSILSINEMLSNEGFVQFTDAQLKLILRLGPVWLKAEYRFEMRQECLLPPLVLARLPQYLRAEYNYERQLFRDQQRSHDGHTMASDDDIADDIESDEDTRPETALVEFSYFIASRSTNDNIWVGDSGASCHMTCSLDGMHNLRTINSPIQIGTGETITCTQVGDKRVKILQQDGSLKDIELKNLRLHMENR